MEYNGDVCMYCMCHSNLYFQDKQKPVDFTVLETKVVKEMKSK